MHSVAVNVKNASTLPDGVFNPSSGGDVFIYLGIGIGVIVLFVIFKKETLGRGIKMKKIINGDIIRPGIIHTNFIFTS